MDFLLHWSVGFLLGTLIALPFITGRWIYDYDSHKWISVCWGPVIDRSTAAKYGIGGAELATPELHPLTSSRFIKYHLIIANTCAVLALAPDFPQLFGANGTDHGIWAEVFFFHATIDKLPVTTGELWGLYLFIVSILVWVIVVTIAVQIQHDTDVKESAVYMG